MFRGEYLNRFRDFTDMHARDFVHGTLGIPYLYICDQFNIQRNAPFLPICECFLPKTFLANGIVPVLHVQYRSQVT